MSELEESYKKIEKRCLVSVCVNCVYEQDCNKFPISKFVTLLSAKVSNIASSDFK